MEIDGLLINGQNAFETYGAIMGDDFLNALDAPAGLKEMLSFDSRTQNGKDYLLMAADGTAYTKFAARDLTLKFRLFGTDSGTLAQRQASLQTRKRSLLDVFCSGDLVAVNVPALNSETYYLIYTGQSISYDLSTDRTTCLIGAKFVEPNPTERYPFGLCSTSASAVAKTATTNGAEVQLVNGAIVRVRFANANTAASPTLQVNTLTAKDIKDKNGEWLTADNWVAGATKDFKYNGTAWVMQ